MDSRVEKELRFLKASVLVLGLTVGVLVFGAFTQQKQRFGEIDVERINFVEKDGTLRMVISNQTRFPGLIFNGKEYTHPRHSAGMLFFNDEGEENGGLTFLGKKTSDGYEADAGLTFDQYHQDQVVGVGYSDESGRQTAGFKVWDRPATNLANLLDKREVILKMPAGAARDSAMKHLFASTPGGATRGYFGKALDKSSVVQLSDRSGKTRLRLVVDSAGVARIEFLDAAGKVMRKITGGDS